MDLARDTQVSRLAKVENTAGGAESLSGAGPVAAFARRQHSIICATRPGHGLMTIPAPMRSVLLVTYDFPPAGGSGVQRIAKFAKYLPAYGWRPVVLTTHRGRSGPRDPTLLEDVEHAEIHRTRAPDLYRWLGAVKRVLGIREDAYPVNLHGNHRGPWHPAAWLIPDGKLPWIPFGARWALTHRRDRHCDVVLSTLPTPTAAVLGSIIARFWRVPHVIDYRDPWSGGYYMPKRFELLRRLESAWERRILAGASAAVIAPGVHESLPRLDTPVEVIHNGFDEEDFVGAHPHRPPNGGFIIAHVGVLWRERGVSPLLAPLRLLRATSPALAEQLHFVQVGRVDRCVTGELEALGKSVRVSVYPSVSHSEAIAYMLGADILYLPTSHDYLPAKTYEYLRSGTPILALGATGSRLHSLLAETGGGEAIDPHHDHEIARYIEHVMTQSDCHQRAKLPALERYSRESSAQALAQVLELVCGSA
jgi:hypothetical protein